VPGLTCDTIEESVSIIKSIIDFVLHLDVHLGQIISSYGVATYAILFAVIFAETGLVFVPFLPGDSLLFAAGAFAAIESLNLFSLLGLLMTAAVVGDTVNYWIGHFIGDRMVANPRLPIKKAHLERTSEFFRKHGGKTIIIARFVPIVRTFAPFVAGAGTMNYGRFISYNVIGGVLWVAVCTLAGYFFGNIPIVKDNFSLVIIGVIAVSMVPILVELWRNRRKR
jgi:membrane-associated protein